MFLPFNPGEPFLAILLQTHTLASGSGITVSRQLTNNFTEIWTINSWYPLSHAVLSRAQVICDKSVPPSHAAWFWGAFGTTVGAHRGETPRQGLFHGPTTWGLVLRRVHFGVQCSMGATWDCVMILLRTCGLSVAKRTTDYALGPITSARRCPASFCLSDFLAAAPALPVSPPLPCPTTAAALCPGRGLSAGTGKSGVGRACPPHHRAPGGWQEDIRHVSVRPNLSRPDRSLGSTLETLIFKQRALNLALHWDYKLHSWFWSQKNRFGEKKP